jgi:hypothetical protein
MLEAEGFEKQFTLSIFYYRDSQINYSNDMNVGPFVTIPFFVQFFFSRCPRNKKSRINDI